MTIPRSAKLLRIFFGEGDSADGAEQRIRAFLSAAEALLGSNLVTQGTVEVIRYVGEEARS